MQQTVSSPTHEADRPGAGARSAIGVAIALGYPILLGVLERFGILVHDSPASLACKGLIVPILLLWVLKVERLGVSSLSIKRLTWATLGFALLAVAATFIAMGVYYRLIAPHFGGSTTPALVHRIAHQPTGQFLLTAMLIGLSAGLVEELVFRCYALSRIEWLTGNRWIASVASLIVFVGLHLPNFGLSQLVPVTLGAIVLTGLYWLRRDYWCNALAHSLIDIAGLTLAAFTGQIQ